MLIAVPFNKKLNRMKKIFFLFFYIKILMNGIESLFESLSKSIYSSGAK